MAERFQGSLPVRALVRKSPLKSQTANKNAAGIQTLNGSSTELLHRCYLSEGWKFSESAFEYWSTVNLCTYSATKPHHPHLLVIKNKLWEARQVTHNTKKCESFGLPSCPGTRMARSCSGSWFPLCRAGHHLKSSRRSVCAQARQSLRKGQVKLLLTSQKWGHASHRLLQVLCEYVVFFCIHKSPDRSLSAGWLCGGDGAQTGRREVSSASPGLEWELEELAYSISALAPWWMQALFRALCSPQHNDTGASELTGTAGVQRFMNKVGMAGSQIKLKIAPGFLNYPCLLVLEQEKDLRHTH